MKPFQSYIAELNKPYEFRIKLATVNPKGEVMDRIKAALETYQLESVSAVKSLPIQEHREFPQWGPCECWMFDIKVAYPTTVPQIRQTIKERAQLNPDWICVRNLLEAECTEEAEMAGKDHEGALLDVTELQADATGQALVGQSRIGSMLKELESRKHEFAEANTVKAKFNVDSDEGKASPVGSSQNTIPNPTKGR
jgi:hypothetical protein